ncbi:restriction endonuclease subunit S [Polaribacter sp. R2A056_3_33]|uniref:restriction endonuclease subunit S n=1 Tax=Polaribacter sp. R2A056_3_33 TaxID=2745563 RepID=UPI001C4F7DE7|nr:restriction endonuclease subunit S [Polaribacter sp. R2A056_3_33]QXP71274.1 restriction endonuclease subunit S [Polaribacter sp. R2A056_3_33]
MVEVENKVQRYDTYKDSGVEWLGEIPTHWEVIRLKNIIRENITDGPHETPVFIDEGIPFLSVDGIQNGELVFENCRYISQKDFIKYKKKCEIEKFDILMGKAASIGKIAQSKVDFEYSIWSPLALIKPLLSKVSSTFLEYYLKSTYSQFQIEILCTSNTQKNISMGDIPKIITTLPPLLEQTKIAQFLDDKTTKIEDAIAIKQQQINLLKERKQILIHKAVTRGLDDSVTLKDSGVEWIGEIPEHWEVKKLKYATRIFRGKFTHRPRNDERMYDGEYPFFQTGDVARAGKYLSVFRQTLNEKGLRVSTLFPKGTIVITIAANIGDISILDIDACFPDSIVGFEPNDFVEKHFLYNSLLVMKEQFMSSTIKNTQMNLNVDRIGSNSIVIPSMEEQKEISAYIETASKKIETAIGLKQQEIAKLKEYKSSLINGGVTGKVKVC